jgi:hypothetical protein
MNNIYVLCNRETRQIARYDCLGEHDGKFTDDPADAKEFSTYGECAEFGQNFGGNWEPESLFSEQPQSVVMPDGWEYDWRFPY